VRDPASDTLVTAPGLQEAPPNDERWDAFLEECIANGEAEATLAIRRDVEEVLAIGLARGRDVVVVLANSHRDTDLPWLRSLLPLIGIALRAAHERDSRLKPKS
jgi:hypothetical protein